MAETATTPMTAPTAVPAPFAGLIAAPSEALPGSRIDWVRRAREEGARLFVAQGVPTVKVEQWKYTPLRALLKVPFRAVDAAAPQPDLSALPAGEALTVDAHALVFVNGRHAPELSDLDTLPPGLRVDSLARLLETEPHTVEPWFGRLADAGALPFAALNQCGLLDGFVVRVREGAMIERPIHIVQISAPLDGEPTAHQPRNLVVLERGAAATVLESWIGSADAAATLRNAVTEVHMAARASLRHYILQNLPRSAYSIAATAAKVEEGAVYDSFVLQMGAALSRHDLRAELAGRHAEVHLNGAYAAYGGQVLDTTSLLDHAAPDCTSNEVYKGVLASGAKGVFQGKILVRQIAQKTDGNQLHKALLLDRGAEVDCKPELEIYADDVKCSHGATAGELDATALFYLRSRGIDPETARSLLIEGFLDDVVERIAAEPLRQAFADKIHLWQQRRAAALAAAEPAA